MISKVLTKINFNFLSIGAALLLVSIAFMLWMLLIKPTYDHAKSISSQLSAATYTQGKLVRMTKKISGLQDDISVIKEQLTGNKRGTNKKKLAAITLKEIDSISKSHKIKFSGITPTARKKMLMFEEVPFDIKVSGNYKNFFHWLQNISEKLTPMGVKSFSIQSSDTKKLDMSILLAAYQLHQDR